MPQQAPHAGTVAIFGATSDIAIAVARRYAAAGCRLVLVGRDAAGLAAVAADLGVRGAAETRTVHADFARLEDIPAVVQRSWQAFGGIDVALIAYGTEPRQQEAEQNPVAAADVLTVNFTSPAILLNELANRFEARERGTVLPEARERGTVVPEARERGTVVPEARERGTVVPEARGTIVAITSVAGDRGRMTNYIYGAAKGGMQRLLEGLRHRLSAAGVAVVDVRPGFVRTKMNMHLERRGLLWATPDRVAADIVRAVSSGTAVCYTPGFWRLIMLAVRTMPRFVSHRTKY